MKKRALIFLFAFICAFPLSTIAFSVPDKPNSYVLDSAAILSSNDIQLLEANLNAFEKETGNEIAVVTIPNLEGDTIENVAQDIFTKWEIGKKDLNNGVLFLVSLEERRMRIHVGYGLEPSLTDIVAHNIEQDVIVPRFKEGNFASGITEGVHAIESVIKDPRQAQYYEEVKEETSFGTIFYIVIFVFVWLGSILGRSKSWWAGGLIGLAIGVVNFFVLFISSVLFINIFALVGLVGFGLLFDYIVSKNYKKNKAIGHTYPWWIGGGGGHSGGGGFGGFGGGASGGGGASSSW
jgi:uncharacterized protein